MSYWIYLLVGMGFGSVLELSGFGDSRRLIAQFYLKEMRVLKVMFTAIVTACVLLYLSSALKLLSIDGIFINPTYLVSGITGGLIMGVGFVVGGFCPGTSLVSVATLKLDGIMFFLGTIFGVGFFGETVSFFKDFYYSTDYGRYLLPEWLGLPAGVVVLLVVLMALAMFYGAELCEHIFGQHKSLRDWDWRPRSKWKITGASTLVGLSLVMITLGQPQGLGKWSMIEARENSKISSREIQVSPKELMEAMRDPMLNVRIYDLRAEHDFNLFHLEGARRLESKDFENPRFYRELGKEPSNTLHMLVAEDENTSVERWKWLRGEGISNVYVLEGGMPQWLKDFPCPELGGDGSKIPANTPALGSRHCVSGPARFESHEKLEFVKKIKIQSKAALKGGCG